MARKQKRDVKRSFNHQDSKTAEEIFASLPPSSEPDETKGYISIEKLLEHKQPLKEKRVKWIRSVTPPGFYRDTGMFIEKGTSYDSIIEYLNRCAQANEVPLSKEQPTDPLPDDALDDFLDSLPFLDELSKIEDEIRNVVATHFTPEEQSRWDREDMIVTYYGWKNDLKRARLFCDKLRSAFANNRINLVARFSHHLGESLAIYRLRKNYEHVVVTAKKQASPREKKWQKDQNERAIRRMDAMAELQRRMQIDPSKSPTEHIEDMAKVTITVKNRPKAKWGNRTTLMGFGLISMVKSPSNEQP